MAQGSEPLKNASHVDVSELSEDAVLIVRKIRTLDGKPGLIEMAVPFDFLTAEGFDLGAYLAEHLCKAEWYVMEQRAKDLAAGKIPADPQGGDSTESNSFVV